MQIARPVILNHSMSPYGISIISTLVFLLGWALPVEFYSRLIDEPDLMFLDAETLLFFLLCVGGFWVGLLLVDFLLPTPGLLETLSRPLRLRGLPLMLPLMVTTTMTILAGVQLLKTAPNLFVLLFAQQGGMIKYQLADVKLGPLGWAVVVQTVVLWWTYWRLSSSRHRGAERVDRGRILSWLIFAVGLLAQIGISILKVSRSDVMPVFGGLAVLYLMGKIQRGELRTPALVRYFLFFPLGIMCLFIGFGALRGVNDVTVALGDFAGYTLASYNRLAALLHGTMRYPYGGHGIYLFGCLSSNNALSSVIPLKTVLGWPDFFALVASEFQAPQLAGLNSLLIWSGAFGYIFSDIGWAAPLILILYGVIYGLVWRQAKLGTALGLTLYPWFAFSVLSWFSSNLVFDFRFPFFVVAGLVLAGYENVLSRFHVSGSYPYGSSVSE
jgi:hypothetical protein